MAESISIQAEFTAVAELAGKEYVLDVKKCLKHNDHNVFFFVTSNAFRPGEHYEMTKSEVSSGKWIWHANARGTDAFIRQIGEAIDNHYGKVK
jgi:hypothetical protein